MRDTILSFLAFITAHICGIIYCQQPFGFNAALITFPFVIVFRGIWNYTRNCDIRHMVSGLQDLYKGLNMICDNCTEQSDCEARKKSLELGIWPGYCDHYIQDKYTIIAMLNNNKYISNVPLDEILGKVEELLSKGIRSTDRHEVYSGGVDSIKVILNDDRN